MKKYILYQNNYCGALVIAENGKGISDVYLQSGGYVPEGEEKSTPLLEQAKKELEEYFQGKRKVFDVPLSLNGTDFQKAVWQELKNIPYGQTRTYENIAQAIDSPKACRAVGMANHRNPIMIMIPCHRVIGKNGHLTGYAGGLNIKSKLLELEYKNK